MREQATTNSLLTSFRETDVGSLQEIQQADTAAKPCTGLRWVAGEVSLPRLMVDLVELETHETHCSCWRPTSVVGLKLRRNEVDGEKAANTDG